MGDKGRLEGILFLSFFFGGGGWGVGSGARLFCLI